MLIQYIQAALQLWVREWACLEAQETYFYHIIPATIKNP